MHIKYDASATLAKFHQSAAFFRGVLGPIGCLPAESEVLTRTGWMPFGEYDGREMAQYHEDGTVSFVVPDKVHDLPCDEMIEFKNAHSLHMVLSPEHEVVYYDWEGKLKKQHAIKIANKINGPTTEGPRYHVPVTFRLRNGCQSGIDLSYVQLRLMVAVIADGHFPKFYRDKGEPRCVITVRKQRKKDRLVSLLNGCGLEWVEVSHNRSGCGSETSYTFTAPMLTKDYSHFWGCNQRQLSRIYEEFRHWDGLIRPCGEIRFSSTSKENMDFIQYVCHATGHRATYGETIDNRENEWNPCFELHATRRLDERITFRNCTATKKKTSNGRKYCVTVPTGMFVARHERCIFVTGNSGKSVCCVNDINAKARQQEPSPIDNVRYSRFAVVRNTFGELKSTTIKTWQEWIPDSMCPIVYDSPIRGHMRYMLPDETIVDMEVLFISMDKPRDVGKVLSLELTGAWVNEARELPKAIIDAISSRVGRYPSLQHDGATWSGIIADTNPPDDDHWWYRFAEKGGWKTTGTEDVDMDYLKLVMDKESFALVKREMDKIKDVNMSWEFFRQPGALQKLPNGTYAINPKAENTQHHKDGYAYWIRQLGGKTTEWIKVYILGEYGSVFDGQPVYSEFTEGIHVSKKPLGVYTQLPLMLGWDSSGLHPACVICQMTMTGQFRVLREVIAPGHGIGIKQFCENCVTPILKQAFPKNTKLTSIGDPAGATRASTDETTMFGMMAACGFECTPSKDKSNSLAPRLQAVQSFLLRMLPGGYPALLIDPSCKTLIKGFRGGYRFERIQIGGEERYKNEPAKNRFSHVQDGLQYVLLNVSPDFKRKRAKARTVQGGGWGAFK